MTTKKIELCDGVTLETKEEKAKYTVLRNKVGCKISGLFTDEEIKEQTSSGEWEVAQIGN